jgi:hypothetical protein
MRVALPVDHLGPPGAGARGQTGLFLCALAQRGADRTGDASARASKKQEVAERMQTTRTLLCPSVSLCLAVTGGSHAHLTANALEPRLNVYTPTEGGSWEMQG